MFKTLNLNVDQSIPAQGAVAQHMDVVADLTAKLDQLRLWAEPAGLKTLRRTVTDLRALHPEPWLTFLGSGDFHHHTLALLESLDERRLPAEGITLVLIDNHPDWFCEQPTFHCGNWVSGVLGLPWVKSIILVAQDSQDLRGHQFWAAPWQSLCSGRVTLHPYQRAQSLVPFKWTSKVQGVASARRYPMGTVLQYQTVAAVGESCFFDELANRLAGQSIYLSVDKDCLQPEAATTDWEQGCLSLSGLLHGIRRLRAACGIVGADVCGESAPKPLKGLAKQLDAGRWGQKTPAAAMANDRNAQTNLAILEAFGVTTSGVETVMEGAALCPG